jgi:hypothetical protein
MTIMKVSSRTEPTAETFVFETFEDALFCGSSLILNIPFHMLVQ